MDEFYSAATSVSAQMLSDGKRKTGAPETEILPIIIVAQPGSPGLRSEFWRPERSTGRQNNAGDE